MQTFLQVNITVANQPSSLARVTDKLRANEVNISAISCTEGRDNTIIHLIVNDPETAKIVLRELGQVTANEVLGFKMRNEPGAIATIGRACAVAGTNIHNIYATTCGKEAMVYVSLEDTQTAISALKQWEETMGKLS